MNELNYERWALTVNSRPHLDGGGKLLAPTFERVIANSPTVFRTTEQPYYKNLLELGCGPAWVGMWLKEQGLCDNLHLSDINPEVMICVMKSLTNKNMEATTYISNMFNDMPSDVKFDCIVVNPPNYVDIQKDHPHGYMADDLRAADKGWAFHKSLYKSCGRYLAPDGEMFISEVDVYSKVVMLAGEVYDRRERVPFEVFSEMAQENGLEITQVGSMLGARELYGASVEILKVKHA